MKKAAVDSSVTRRLAGKPMTSRIARRPETVSAETLACLEPIPDAHQGARVSPGKESWLIYIPTIRVM
jgi:hypothetical protein